MRVLALPRYEPLGASSRLRFYQYLPYLRDVAGMEIQTEPLLSDDYVQSLYSANVRRDSGAILRSYARRGSLLRRASRHFDLVWMEKEAFPYLPAWGERLLNRSRIPYVVDYDDATFHQYDTHRRPQIRQLLGGKIAEVMRRAEIVVAGNTYIADYARQHGAKRVEYLPTAVDTDQYRVVETGADHPFTIGWIGTPLTATYLNAIRPALQRVCEGGQGTLQFVGAGSLHWHEREIRSRPWSAETEIEQIQQFTVGIMPLPDAPFERGKCGYKLIQCMACGIPVVASPVGVNRTLIRHGENGFLAETESDWVDALSRLRDDTNLRIAMGAAARRTIEDEFSTAITAPRLAALLAEAVHR